MNTHAIKLIKKFNPLKLKEAYDSISNNKAIPAGYPGEGHRQWNSICIFSFSSKEHSMLEKLPYIKKIFEELNLKICLARFLILEPNGIIKEHRDSFLDSNIMRLHIPVITHPNVEFYIDNHRCHWYPGELWYGNFTKNHRGENRSEITRVHLVIDVIINKNLIDLFPKNNIPENILSNNFTNVEKNNFSLENFSFQFTLPQGFSLPGLNYQMINESLSGYVQLIENELYVFINNQPLLKAMPVSEDTLDLIGLGLSARLQYIFDNNNIKSVMLTIENNNIKLM